MFWATCIIVRWATIQFLLGLTVCHFCAPCLKSQNSFAQIVFCCGDCEAHVVTETDSEYRSVAYRCMLLYGHGHVKTMTVWHLNRSVPRRLSMIISSAEQCSDCRLPRANGTHGRYLDAAGLRQQASSSDESPGLAMWVTWVMHGVARMRPGAGRDKTRLTDYKPQLPPSDARWLCVRRWSQCCDRGRRATYDSVVCNPRSAPSIARFLWSANPSSVIYQLPAPALMQAYNKITCRSRVLTWYAAVRLASQALTVN